MSKPDPVLLQLAAIALMAAGERLAKRAWPKDVARRARFVTALHLFVTEWGAEQVTRDPDGHPVGDPELSIAKVLGP